MNLQPVRYYTRDDGIYICRKSMPLKNALIGDMQQIDVGIAMANMYVACDGDCVFVRQSAPPELPDDCIYEYTMRLN